MKCNTCSVNCVLPLIYCQSRNIENQIDGNAFVLICVIMNDISSTTQFLGPYCHKQLIVWFLTIFVKIVKNL